MMDFLLNDWIELFNDKNFECLKNVPIELKSVTMLFVTLQNELKRVESFLTKKIKILQSTCETESKASTSHAEYDVAQFDELSPPRENTCSNTMNIQEHTKALLKSPTFSRHRKKLNLKKINKSNLPLKIFPLKTSNNDVPKMNDSTNINCTDVIEDNDILDCSIIGITPNVNLVRKAKSKFRSPRKRLRSVCVSKESTLTQMFSEMVTRREPTKDDSSLLGIEEIIDKIDKGKCVDASNFCSINEKSYLDIWEDIKVNSFIADYDKIPELPKSPKKKFVYKETVRGNEKKKLKGWSCKECENFYKGMNLPEKELEKKMDECSKHRSRFKPDEETIPGYWDLSIPPTPEDQITQTTNSNQESIGNDSTVFCFYKN